MMECADFPRRALCQHPPLACRPSPPQGGRSDVSATFTIATPRCRSGHCQRTREAGREGRAFRTSITWRDPRAPPAISVRARSAALHSPLAGPFLLLPPAEKVVCAAPSHPARSSRRGTSGRGLPGSALRGQSGGAVPSPRNHRHDRCSHGRGTSRIGWAGGEVDKAAQSADRC